MGEERGKKSVEYELLYQSIFRKQKDFYKFIEKI